MKRPSKLIFAFILAIASVFLVYALGRVFWRTVSPPEINIEEEYSTPNSRTTDEDKPFL